MKKDPEGYKKLLVYKKSDELHAECLKFAEEIKRAERGKRVEEEKRTESEKRVEGETTYTHSSLPIPFNKTLLELADQIGRAGRSPKSNIVEGWKRNTTAEYHQFLGYSIASCEEIHEDATDIIRGKYPELMGVKGIVGGRGAEITELDPLRPLNP